MLPTMSVSGFTFSSALRHGNIRPSVAINQRVASSARRGLTLRSWKSASCLRRKRFSAARELRERTASKASVPKSKAAADEVRRQCATAWTSNDTGMKDPTLWNVTRTRFQRDGVFAEDRFLRTTGLDGALMTDGVDSYRRWDHMAWNDYENACNRLCLSEISI